MTVSGAVQSVSRPARPLPARLGYVRFGEATTVVGNGALRPGQAGCEMSRARGITVLLLSSGAILAARLDL
jgi:hypothetical protein